MYLGFNVDPDVAKCVYEKDKQLLTELKAKRERLKKAGKKTFLIDEKIEEITKEMTTCAYYAFGEH